MTVPRDELILLLRDGLDSTDWAKVCASRGSLKVRIANLRSDGFTITSTPDPSLPRKRQGSIPVRYQIVEGPKHD